MIGSSTYALCSGMQNKNILLAALVVAAVGIILPAYVGMSAELTKFNLWAFLIFEFAVGMYFPTICTLKSDMVPEAHRSTIYNLFRAPMNAIVVSVLLVNPDLGTTFRLVCQLLMGAAICTGVLKVMTATSDKDAKNASLEATPLTSAQT